MQNRKPASPRWWSQTAKLAEESRIAELGSFHCPVPLITSLAPKPPKKRFLEAATAQQQQQMNYKTPEDTSALMQLAEMCVLHEKPQVLEKRPVPRVIVPLWSWARPQDNENEEPLDLSGEHTIQGSQQDLINHLVEKLCSKPDMKSQPSSVAEVSSSNSRSISTYSSMDESFTTANTQVSSNCCSTSQDVKLPLKKRELTLLCDSTVELNTAEPVTSTSGLETPPPLGKPAPRSCKGKRYLEFMFEGRIPLGHRVKRLQLQNSEATTRRSRRRPGRVPVEVSTSESETKRQSRGRRSLKFRT